MLLNRDIPSSKMEVVRSLLANDKLLPEEKFGAVIDLVKNCPEKKRIGDGLRVETAGRKKIQRPVQSHSSPSLLSGLSASSVFIDELYSKYSHTGIFRKKYLLHSGKWFRLSVKKRLVPSRKFFRLLSEISAAQEKILPRISTVCDMIVADPEASDPILYNYLRALSGWLSMTPFAGLDYSAVKWFDVPAFENELRHYFSRAFSFFLLSVDVKEKIILGFENRLRSMPDLIKEESGADDSDPLRSAKEAANLKREKRIYDYMMIIRSFIPTVSGAAGSLDGIMEKRYSVSSLREMLCICFETMVFRRPVTENEIITYYTLKPLQPRNAEWDCSDEVLKKFGKDPESVKTRKIDFLKADLGHLDEIVGMIGLKYEGGDVLLSSFEEQWKMINRRRVEASAVRTEDYMLFIDELIHFFEKAFVPFLDGTVMVFTLGRIRAESAVFTKNSFERKIQVLSDIIRDLNSYRMNVPNEKITREEARKIINGSIKTMDHITSFFLRIGSFFYSTAYDLHALMDSHEKNHMGGPVGETDNIRPFNMRELEGNSSAVIPFADFVFSASDVMNPALKLLSGKPFYSGGSRDGIFGTMLSFCYQLAYELSSNELMREIEHRRDIRNEIKMLGGKL